ncbi:DUF1203 domain-containing protein [Cognatishimia maritima]|uniref:DUF1203 domain-containing protein n=1 Tax=Cognatishimia maritima TaxID=870908 RepID=A0A1M5KJB8_9RHOB|nr:DUF1203 domain-containing protein [Cognatishimia maritima]SHG52808.1 Protein of unknown function [Cognatishimia maritima]
MDFRFKALPAKAFKHLFKLTDQELASQNAKRLTVTACPGVPCRVSMKDAEVGETVILMNYVHLNASSPFDASHAIYVRELAEDSEFGINEVPELLATRMISLRFFNRENMMIAADLVSGERLSIPLSEAFENPEIAYAHVHYAKPGCFAASVHRVESNT